MGGKALKEIKSARRNVQLTILGGPWFDPIHVSRASRENMDIRCLANDERVVDKFMDDFEGEGGRL